MMTMAQATENAGSVLTVPDMTPERPSRDKGLTRSYALENVLTQAETRTHHPAAAGQSDKNESIRTLDESEITSNDANEPAPKTIKALESMLEKNKAAGKEWARKRKEQGLDDDLEAIEGSDDPTTDEHQPMATEESGTESIVSDDLTPEKKTTTKAKGKARDAVQA